MQFKLSAAMKSSDIKGMTVFNPNKVDTKKQPMFFGQPLGVQRYDSYKYPAFENLTKQQLGYFWRPEEVSLQKDRGDYQMLRPEQKHIYTSNLKYQIMLDSVQGRAPGMALHSVLFDTRTRGMYGSLVIYGDDTLTFLYIYHKECLS